MWRMGDMWKSHRVRSFSKALLFLNGLHGQLLERFLDKWLITMAADGHFGGIEPSLGFLRFLFSPIQLPLDKNLKVLTYLLLRSCTCRNQLLNFGDQPSVDSLETAGLPMNNEWNKNIGKIYKKQTVEVLRTCKNTSHILIMIKKP